MINAVDKFIILDDANFRKQGFINRNTILSQGKKQQINIQINSISSSKLILEHELNNNFIWKKKLLKAIHQNYSKAIYFSKVYPIIEECILFDSFKLSNYLTYQIKQIALFLNISTEIVKSSSIYPKIDLVGQERLLNICKKESATMYINAIGGQELYSKKIFNDNNIELKFIKTGNIQYRQFTSEFVPFLSIIDVMMFNSTAEIKKMLNKYTLI